MPKPQQQLAVHQDDADILLKGRNVLNAEIVAKYRTAGEITQAALQHIVGLINSSYHLKTTDQLYTVQQLCLLTDSFMQTLLDGVYTTGVAEKTISQPTSIDVNELIGGGFSPEIDNTTDFTLKAGDVATISLGVHIDGYTSQLSHTVVIYPPGPTPEGPLLTKDADAVCATHIATETISSLLGLSLSPEKIPTDLAQQYGQQVSGSMIRAIVDFVAESFNCVVLPGSKVRRIRRFLAGQSEGIVAERDFKGVVWDESHQEERLLGKSELNKELVLGNKRAKPRASSTENTIPTDEFVVEAGEVYQVDIRMSSVSHIDDVGIITTQEVDEFLGKNNKNEFNAKSTIFVRDVIIKHALKLKTSRKLLADIDTKLSVYPFKLSHTCKQFPAQNEEDVAAIEQELRRSKIGMTELHNRHLVKAKPISVTKFVPLEKILLSENRTGAHGIDATRQVLPGMEVPMPKLGVSQLLLQQIAKSGTNIANVRESTTVLVDKNENEVLRLNGSAPSYVHSSYKLKGGLCDAIEQVVRLAEDARFGIKVTKVGLFQK